MAESACAVCGEATINKCGRCISAHYCSTKCQNSDRPLHKFLCNTFTTFLTTRPASQKFNKVYDDLTPVEDRVRSSCNNLAILFPESSNKPELIWLNVQTIETYVPTDRSRLAGYDNSQSVDKDLERYMDLPTLPLKSDLVENSSFA
jgi:hypothetical protein